MNIEQEYYQSLKDVHEKVEVSKKHDFILGITLCAIGEIGLIGSIVGLISIPFTSFTLLNVTCCFIVFFIVFYMGDAAKRSIVATHMLLMQEMNCLQVFSLARRVKKIDEDIKANLYPRSNN